MSDNRTKEQREHDRALIGLLRAAEWDLDTVAHKLGANQVTADEWKELLEKLDHLTSLVRQRTDDHGPLPVLYPKETE